VTAPKGPRGEKRPADAVGAAVRVARISVGDEPDDRQDEQPARSPAQQLGKLGGAAGTNKLTRERLTEIAKKAAAKRWNR
jgi:hypothetical protein